MVIVMINSDFYCAQALSDARDDQSAFALESCHAHMVAMFDVFTFFWLSLLLSTVILAAP
jgi:hypothetical protein